IRAVEIEGSRTRKDINDSAARIERHARPIVCSPGGFPSMGRPSVIAELARVGNDVKRPAQLTGANVEGAHVARRCRQSFRVPATDDDEIFVDDSGASKVNRLGSGRLATQILAEVDSPLVSEAQNGLARSGVKGV